MRLRNFHWWGFAGGLLFATAACMDQRATTALASTPSIRTAVGFFPGVLPRSAWGKAGPDLQRLTAMNGVERIVVCHGGDPIPFTTCDKEATAQHLEAVREYHRSRNFADIAYHFAIDPAGRVWELRPLKFTPQAVRYHNDHTVSVVLLGNFSLQKMTAAQRATTVAFLHALRLRYQLPLEKVQTKRELVPCTNPGEDAQTFMDLIRREHQI